MLNKETYQEQLESQLEVWNGRLIRIRETLCPDEKTELQQQEEQLLEELEMKKRALQERMQLIAGAEQNNWPQIRQSIDLAATELLQALEQANNQLKVVS